MRSLPSIVKKRNSEQEEIKPYDFFAGFVEETRAKARPSFSEASEGELSEEESEAARILERARKEAEKIKEEAYHLGFEQGKEEGFSAGRQEGLDRQRFLIEEKTAQFEKDFKQAVESVSEEKRRALEKYIDDLKEISLSVAEKIIKTSIRSSGDIVKRMIISATDKLKKKRWARIYVTKCDLGVTTEVDEEFVSALSRLSDNVQVIAMDGGEEGFCIIELPDEIIDTSVGTQLENIRDVINNARV